ncbi:MAG: 50S ribosomal protein L33 [Candidatus Kerfeldbacteria bacterium]|nr:50S ribosomal protein L33 [Candidatus Kerfeldbacteria bacterium]
MSQDNLIKLECSVCHRTTHHTYRNKKKVKSRLEIKKYCRWCKKHTLHKETK